jgi:threonine/homoserine/homoserine lactone efflux protein
MGVTLATLGAFFLTSIAIELTPGPNMAYLALVGVSRGRADGLMAVAGVAIGLAALGAAVGVGLGSVILENRVVYEVLRWAGAAYLVWLAFDSWRDGRRPLGEEPLPPGGWMFLRRGFVTNAINPKAALFFVTVLPSFVSPSYPVFWQMVTLVAVYVAAATLVHAAIVLMSSTLSPLFQRPKVRRRAGVAFAISLVAVAAWLVVKTAP